MDAKCHDQVMSDSDRSSVDFCDLVVSKHKIHFSNFFGIITNAYRLAALANTGIHILCYAVFWWSTACSYTISKMFMNPQECYNIEYSNKTVMSEMVDEYQY